jgi:hypothetical protein
MQAATRDGQPRQTLARRDADALIVYFVFSAAALVLQWMPVLH